MKRPKKDSGAILLLVMLVMSILFVVVGQLSYSVTMDRMLANNHMTDARARCDMAGALACLRSQAASGMTQSPIAVELSTGAAVIEWTDESGKFNVNNLLSDLESSNAEVRIERLFEILEQRGIVDEPGLADRITDYVLTLERPLVTLGELLQVKEITPEILRGSEGSGGLDEYITVYTDGKINPSAAPDEVIMSLADGISRRDVDPLRAKLENPSENVPPRIAALAKGVKNAVSTTSRAYYAKITLRGELVSKYAEAAVRIEKQAPVTVLYNELGESHAEYSE